MVKGGDPFGSWNPRSSFILLPSSFCLHPSAFILHPSSFILHLSALRYQGTHWALTNELIMVFQAQTNLRILARFPKIAITAFAAKQANHPTLSSSSNPQNPFMDMFRNLVINQVIPFMAWAKRSLHDLVNRRVNSIQIEQLRIELLDESTLDHSYLILIISSCVIATLGLLLNSAAVIIGAMIIAPLMSPIRGLAFGALAGEVILFWRGLIAIIVGTLLAVILAFGIGYLSDISVFGSEILARSKPNLLDLGVAIAAGSISGYAKIRPKISGSLAGTAIAVALMPPICVVGLGLADTNWVLSLGAFILYLTNLMGITLACMVAFLLTGYAPFRSARKALISTTLLTGFLLLPLGSNFVNLVRKSHLERELQEALVNRTITFQKIDLLKVDVNWLTYPPEARLRVRSREQITPRQVTLLEEFLNQSMGQPFTLILEVSQIEEVRGEGIIEPVQGQPTLRN